MRRAMTVAQLMVPVVAGGLRVPPGTVIVLDGDDQSVTAQVVLAVTLEQASRWMEQGVLHVLSERPDASEQAAAASSGHGAPWPSRPATGS